MWTLTLMTLLACRSTEPPTEAPSQPGAEVPEDVTHVPDPKNDQNKGPDCTVVYSANNANSLFSWGRGLKAAPCTFEQVHASANSVDLIFIDAEETEAKLTLTHKLCAGDSPKGTAAGNYFIQEAEGARALCATGLDAVIAAATADSIPPPSEAR